MSACGPAPDSIVHHAFSEDCPSTENPESLQNRPNGNGNKAIMNMMVCAPAITRATNDQTVVALLRTDTLYCVKVASQRDLAAGSDSAR